MLLLAAACCSNEHVKLHTVLDKAIRSEKEYKDPARLQVGWVQVGLQGVYLPIKPSPVLQVGWVGRLGICANLLNLVKCHMNTWNKRDGTTLKLHRNSQIPNSCYTPRQDHSAVRPSPRSGREGGGQMRALAGATSLVAAATAF